MKKLSEISRHSGIIDGAPVRTSVRKGCGVHTRVRVRMRVDAISSYRVNVIRSSS